MGLVLLNNLPPVMSVSDKRTPSYNPHCMKIFSYIVDPTHLGPPPPSSSVRDICFKYLFGIRMLHWKMFKLLDPLRCDESDHALIFQYVISRVHVFSLCLTVHSDAVLCESPLNLKWVLRHPSMPLALVLTMASCLSVSTLDCFL